MHTDKTKRLETVSPNGNMFQSLHFRAFLSGSLARPYHRISSASRRRLGRDAGVHSAASSRALSERLLTNEDLVASLRAGCKTRNKFRFVLFAARRRRALTTVCRIGTEHEKLGYNVDDLTRLDYSKIEQLLKSLHKRFGWEPIMEKDLIIGEDIIACSEKTTRASLPGQE